jgi:CheY-like chemotaxis protein
MTMRDSVRPAPRCRSPHLRILLVDDNEVLLTAIRGMLRVLGHTADVARNGREALEAASRRAYDVVLLDVQMPEMGGFEAARRLRRDAPTGNPPRIVGFSGERADPELYLAAGMDDFLVKPVRSGDLVRVLDFARETRVPMTCHGSSL